MFDLIMNVIYKLAKSANSPVFCDTTSWIMVTLRFNVCQLYLQSTVSILLTNEFVILKFQYSEDRDDDASLIFWSSNLHLIS